MEFFLQIVKYFGNLMVDFFDSDLNHHVPMFFSRYQMAGAEQTDTLMSLRPPGLLYAFLPNLLMRMTVLFLTVVTSAKVFESGS